MIFGANGVWSISNLSLDLVDDFGNIQSEVHRVSGDIILWGDAGIASWAGGIVVPALDDVYVMGVDGTARPITGGRESPWDGGIRNLYRSYTTTAGYAPGIACVYRGHYFLPVVSGTTWVDTLVCRLDRGAAWTRWSGHAAGTGFTVYPGTSAAAAKLLSATSPRVSNLSGCFAPTSSNSQDADATDITCTIDTSDYPTSATSQPGTVMRARAKYVLTDDGNGATAAPTVSIKYSSDQDGGTYTTLTDTGGQNGTTGWSTSDGSSYSWTRVTKKRDRIRFRIVASGACASFVFRSLRLLIRPSGRQ